MKKVILLIAFVSISFISNVEAVTTIDETTLKEMMDSGSPFILLDARGDHWNDKNIIPGAKLAASDFSEARLATLIPDKMSLIVVYAFSSSCPKGRMLVDKLTSLGYEKIMEYPEGLEVWRDVSGNPVDEIK
jgi:hypothetical protein